MKTISLCALSALAIPLLAGFGCSSGGDPSPGSTLLSGNIVSLNGQTAKLDGVVLKADDGTAAISLDDGSFELGSLPSRATEIEIETESGDDRSRLATFVTIDLSGGGRVHIRVSIDEGRLVRLSVERPCESDDDRKETRAPLSPVVAGLEGFVRTRVRSDGRQGFDVEVEHLTPGTGVLFVVIDPTSGAEDEIGSVVADSFGKAEVELRTNDGAALPFDVADVAELEDFEVEVRNGDDGSVLLEGSVPAIGALPICDAEGGAGDDRGGSDDRGDEESDDDGDDDSGRGGDGSEVPGSGSSAGLVQMGEARLANADGISGTARVELRSRPEHSEEKIEIEVFGTNSALPVEFWLEDPGAPGTFVREGELAGVPEEKLALEIDTREGDELPFGVAAVSELAGLGVELRVADTGAVVYSGELPPLRRF